MKKIKTEIPILEQWVEVLIEDGVTRTTLYPPNAVLMEEAETMVPRPELVYRRIHFPMGVPMAYQWTEPDEQTRQFGGGCVQRLTVKDWLETIAFEASFSNGHIGLSRHPAVPRPKERGGCDCDLCVQNEYVLHELGYET